MRISKPFYRRFLALLPVLFVGLLLSQQAACTDEGGEGAPEGPFTGTSRKPGKQEKQIDPDKFGLSVVEEKNSRSSKNFAIVTITPGSADMKLGDLFITASVEGNEGTLQGSGGPKSRSGFNYNVPLNNQSLEGLFLTNGLNCLGREDQTFKAGKKISFRIEYKPAPGTQAGTEYTLTVTVARQGAKPHTETDTVVLKAPQNIPVAEGSGDQSNRGRGGGRKKKQGEEAKKKEEEA